MTDSLPSFTELRSIEQYRKLLRTLHTLSATESHTTLVRMLEGLLASPLGPEEQLEVLESARQTITFVQHEISSRYAAHPLPPDSAEDATLRQVVRLWTALSTAYARLSERSSGKGGDDFRAQWPLLAQRRIQYLGQIIIEYFRARRAEPPGAWKAVHAAYLEAEKAGVAHSRVIDPLNNTWKAQSPDEAYIALLLVDLTNPYGRDQRELHWICRWAQRFAPYCIMQTEWEQDDDRAYGLDANEDHGLRPIALIGPRPGMRRFDGHQLAAQIKAMLTEFKQGTTPASLGLGDDCVQPACARLLVSLYRPWGMSAAGRRFPRRPKRGGNKVCTDWDSIGLLVSGKEFIPPNQRQIQGSSYDINVITFGGRAEEVDPALITDPEAEVRRRGHSIDEWLILDHSVSGFRMQRKHPVERIEHHQLIGLKPSDGTQYLLGQVSWLMYEPDGTLLAGIHLLGGLPTAVAIRGAGINVTHSSPYSQGFMLPEVAAMRAPATIILPGNSFHADRVLEVHGSHAMQLRLTSLVTRGANFDQATYEVVSR
ncbi:hypothetical protein [Zoogloea sp.]|uniref:hypothetical protein n=1 Tax=Zoogloea sp. TaxID=49181 RepID=UPI002629871C|nr:hypothetical protein [Zoogloea sp.]MDD3352465.1 hypothetical protein [Zoogloea sp.]